MLSPLHQPSEFSNHAVIPICLLATGGSTNQLTSESGIPFIKHEEFSFLKKIVLGHQLISKELTLVTLESFRF